MFGGMLYVPLGIATVIYFSNPLLIGFFAKCMIKETVSKITYLCAIGAFMGVFIVTFSFHKGEPKKEYPRPIIGIVLEVVGAFVGGFAMVTMRLLALNDVKP